MITIYGCSLDLAFILGLLSSHQLTTTVGFPRVASPSWSAWEQEGPVLPPLLMLLLYPLPQHVATPLTPTCPALCLHPADIASGAIGGKIPNPGIIIMLNLCYMTFLFFIMYYSIFQICVSYLCYGRILLGHSLNRLNCFFSSHALDPHIVNNEHLLVCVCVCVRAKFI